jgi:uncharacterized protein
VPGNLQALHLRIAEHGGEPTLLPLGFYRRALLAQARLKHPDQQIRNGVQTNGTLLNDEWCQFLAENRFRVGVSIDGPGDLQDGQRPFVSGRGSSKEVERGIRLLQEWGVEFGVLMVVDRATLALGPRAIFDFIVALGIERVGFIPAKPASGPASPLRLLAQAEHYTGHEELTAFLLGLYDAWERHGDRKIEIREIEALRKRIRGVNANVCTLTGSCVGRHFLVEANGDFAHCDLYVGDPEYTVGNVHESGFVAICKAKPLVRLQRAASRESKEMSVCPYYSVCNGGCPHDRYLARRYDPKHDSTCCGQRALIAGLTERMRGAPLPLP